MAELSQNLYGFGRSDVREAPGVRDVIGAEIGRRWSFVPSALDAASRELAGGVLGDNVPTVFGPADPNFDPIAFNAGTRYERLFYMFEGARNELEAVAIRKNIDTAERVSDITSRASLGANVVGSLGAGISDPTAFIPFVVTGGNSIWFNVAKAALTVGSTEAVIQHTRYRFDGTVTGAEAATEAGMTTVFGGAVGAGATVWKRYSMPLVPGVSRIRVAQIRERLAEDNNGTQVLAQIADMNWDTFSTLGNRSERQLGSLDDAGLQSRLDSVNEQTDLLLDPEESDVGAAIRKAQEENGDAFDALRSQAAELQTEITLRDLEARGYQPDSDLYKVADNWFTDSFLYRGVPTPFKSIIQSNVIPSSVKRFVLELAGDNSIAPIAAKMGITSSGSVYTRSVSEYAGRWVSVLDETKDLYRQAKQLPDSAKLDISLRDAWANLRNSPDSYQNWMIEVNRKRVFGEEGADQYEIEALDVMDRFWKNAEQDLINNNLVGTIDSLNRELAALRVRLDETTDRMESFLEGDPIDASRRGYLRPRDDDGVVQQRSFLGRTADEKAANKRNYFAAAKTQQTIDKKIQSNWYKIQDFKKASEPQEAFFARFLNIDKIKSNRSGFARDLRTYYNAEISAGRTKISVYDSNREVNADGSLGSRRGWVKIDLTGTNAKGISNLDTHINRVIDDILSTEDPASLDEISFGIGRSKHLRHRKLEVPNSAIWDWIEKDPVATMRAYSDRVGPRIEFKSRFGRDVEEMVDVLNEDMVKAGMSQVEIDKAMLDVKILYDRIAGMVTVNPDALNQKVAFALKEMAAFAYMGSAGFSALPDFAKIILEHDGSNIVRGTQTFLDSTAMKMSKKDTRLAGSALEIVLSNVQRRFVDDMAYDVNANSLWGKARSAFYVLNGLSPMTQTAKMLDGVIRSHEIIDYSLKAHAGKATKKELQFLARYGISAKHTATISRMPWEKHTGGLYLANTSEWTAPPARTSDSVPPRFEESLGMGENEAPMRDSVPDGPGPRGRRVNEASPPPRDSAPGVDSYPADSEADVKEALLAFRAALHSGAVNTVVHATPADRPRIADGVAYVPMSIARKMGLKEDPRYRGYARIENGLLGLPLQFYSFALGAVNKTMASAAHGQMKNLTVGFAAMMGLSYLSLKMKMPDYAWDQLSWQDTAFRAFDQAGIAALYSDLMYTGIHTSLALGGPNPTGGLVSPKFNQQRDPIGAITGLAGAGPSWADDMLRNGLGQWAQGEWGEGSKTIVRNLPAARLVFWKDLTNEMTRAWGQ